MCGWEDYDQYWTKKSLSLNLENLKKEKEELKKHWKKFLLTPIPKSETLVISSYDPNSDFYGPIGIIDWVIKHYFIPIENWNEIYYVICFLEKEFPNSKDFLNLFHKTYWKISFTDKIEILKREFPEFDFGSSLSVIHEGQKTIFDLPTIKISSQKSGSNYPVFFSMLDINQRRLLINKFTTNIMKESASNYFNESCK